MTGVEFVWPMPDRIARLPRDRRGFPIPWVVTWSRDEPGVPVARQRRLMLPGVDWVGHVSEPYDLVGEGVPQFKSPEPGREILGHEECRCSVCGEIIGRKLTFVGGLLDDVEQRFTEAPLHRECARWALRTCPGLLGAKRDGNPLAVTIINQEDRRYAGMFIDREGEEVRAHFEDIDDSAPLVLVKCIMFAGHGRTVDSDEWLDR